MTNPIADAERIASLLGEAPGWGPIEVVESTGSTNADVAALARAGAEPGLVLVAREQTAGRGRLDRTWVSPPDRSVAMSLLLRPDPGFERWGWLSLLAGLAVESALAELAPPGATVELKWPNDVLVGGGKVCGILSERVEHADGARAVVGIGLNISLEADDLPVPTATSLLLEGFDPDPNPVVAGVLRHFAAYYARWQAEGSLRAEYEARCASVGSELTITVEPSTVIHGRGHGVDEFGRLRVATATGVSTFTVGDVVHARMNR